jgi:hypothetical protein
MDHPHLLPNNICVLGEYVITYDASIKTEMFSCADYNEIMFHMENGRYQIVNNYHMGPRLIINPAAGGFRDVPFKPETFWLLPPGVRANQLSTERFSDVGFTR